MIQNLILSRFGTDFWVASHHCTLQIRLFPVSFHPGAYWEGCHFCPPVHNSTAQLCKPPKFDSSRRSLATAGISVRKLDGCSSGARGGMGAWLQLIGRWHWVKAGILRLGDQMLTGLGAGSGIRCRIGARRAWQVLYTWCADVHKCTTQDVATQPVNAHYINSSLTFRLLQFASWKILTSSTEMK